VMLSTEGGAFHNCAVLQSGAVVCWGRNTDGRLGYALGPLNQSVGDDETPAQFVAQHGSIDVGGTVTQIVTGSTHTCALLDDATVRCWGIASAGQLGYGNGNTIGDDETPASAGPVPIGGPVLSLGAGWTHTCAILTGGQVKCWGRGNEGRLGYGNVAWLGLLNTPESVGFVDVGGVVVKIDGGNAHTCALLDDGTIRCWGWGGRGQLGYGNTTNIGDNETPASAGPVEIGGLAVDIIADGNHTCAIRDDGRVLCWGDAGEGRLGYGNVEFVGDDEFPASVGPVPLF
jgi:alpha-tubulin suppressor-like RCC1 family protein